MAKQSVIVIITLLLMGDWLCLVTGFHHTVSRARCDVSLRQEQGGNSDIGIKGIRLNKVFKATHSRRAADALIASGRVTVNDVPVTEKGGSFVIPFVDVIKLDGKPVSGWETLNGITQEEPNSMHSSQNSKSSNEVSTKAFEYVKYWKPRGVICTTDRGIPYNIIDEIERDGYKPNHRVFPVGRLDKDTSGLILLTSDGRLPNASLRKQQKQPKIYEVFVDRAFSENDLERLRNGIVITTVAQRDRKAKPLTAKTRPCLVEQISENAVEMTLFEGRNRQIRKMLDALDYKVMALHRVNFSGISLKPLYGPGSWKRLDKAEMKIIRNLLSTTDTGVDEERSD